MSDTRTTAPAAALDFTQCPNWGQGGSFVYDPVTRQRTRAVTEVQALQVLQVQQQQPATEAQLPVAEPVPQKKEKNRG